MIISKRQPDKTEFYKTSLSKLSEQGFTLLEVMVALGIFAVGILGVASLHMSSISGNDFAMEHTEALSQAKSRIDRLMTLPFVNVVDASEIINGNTVTWTVTPAVGIDMKQVEVVVLDNDGKTLVTLNFSKPNL
ncbi:MAG: prepilin-type N-terminal cleavage/methylation domain-containing protein [Desulfobacula sp.]|jgi:type II secretion system protein I|nr:prepilin-type N-terminal cleavage/methylation domain-containing protein [Desulfobacula sp.]